MADSPSEVAYTRWTRPRPAHHRRRAPKPRARRVRGGCHLYFTAHAWISFVDSNDRELKRIQPFVDEANDLEEEIKALSDAEIRERFTAIRDSFRETVIPEEPSEDELHHPDLERRREFGKLRRKRDIAAVQDALDDVAAEVFAMAREAMQRTLGMRHFDEQLIGAHRVVAPPAQ